MTQEQYTWTDNPTVSGISSCNTDILNDCLMHLKYDKKGGSGLEVCDIGMALYIDETKGLRRYLNGQIVDINANTQVFLNRLKEITTLHPSLLCTEDEWQTAKTMSAFGQVGKFVFNYSGDEVVSVRIPRVVNVQGVFDLQNLGMTVEAGLPDLTLRGYSLNMKYGYMNGQTLTDSGSSEASKQNPIYGNSNTVQQEAIQYPYFIQIATGSETENNIINDIELNNPFSLFDSKYSDHELNNLSWLKSEGQWNAKAVYPTAYNKLLKVYNGTEIVEGLSVKLWTDESATDYDFRINTSDETFMLPIKVKQKFYNEIASVVGNGSAIGVYSDDISVGGLSAQGDYRSIAIKPNNYNLTAGGNSVVVGWNHGVGLTTDSTKSGIEAHLSENTNLYLYFYVGETVQNANLIDAGRIGEILPTKTDKVQAARASMPSSKYIDLTLGASSSYYTAPADGYFSLNSIKSSNGQVVLTNQTASVGSSRWVNANSSFIINTPARKGDTVALWYDNSLSLSGVSAFFRFVYAEGEV